MNKKGFTLIEVIVVVALVASLGTLGAIGLSKIISNSKEQRYNEMIEDIKAAGNAYFTIYSEKEDYFQLKDILYEEGRLIIPISTLKNALLLDENLQNPKTSENIYDGCVIIAYDNNIISYSVSLTNSECN